jgi:hypothetical protein
MLAVTEIRLHNIKYNYIPVLMNMSRRLVIRSWYSTEPSDHVTTLRLRQSDKVWWDSCLFLVDVDVT